MEDMEVPKFASDRPEPLRKRLWRSKWFWVVASALLLFTVFNFRASARSAYDNYVRKAPADGEQELLGSSDRDALTDDEAVLGSTKSRPSPPKPSSDIPIPDNVPIDHSKPRSRLTKEMQETLEWDPPIWASLHVPDYDAYAGRDYDPNRWEGFKQNVAYFEKNTIGRDNETSEPWIPYPDYNSPEWSKHWKGEYVACKGLNGELFNESNSERIRAYNKEAHHFAEPDIGSFEAVGLDGSRCFDRVSALDPYGGFDFNEDKKMSDIKLGELQYNCLGRNKERYKSAGKPRVRPGTLWPDPEADKKETARFREKDPKWRGPQPKPRTAVLIRSWEGYRYQENDIHTIRSLVSELALQSGGEYTVFLFVNLKDENVDIFSDPDWYEEKMSHIPQEFRDMTILWNEKICADMYPTVGQYQVLLAQFMPVQWFMKTHPEFEYVWNWEMDARYIGQHYHFTESVAQFAKEQPRKYLWERNARFYIPKEHGTWNEYFDDTNEQIRSSSYVPHPIWGKHHFEENFAIGPDAPHKQEEDRFDWGVGEEADFVSLLPIWDPRHGVWGWKNAILHYPDPIVEVPRRAYINTHARFSRKLIHAMHLENAAGRLMVTEMCPTSVALHHGLKAVYVPQPIWLSHEWPSFYADAVFNSDGWSAGSFKNASEPPNDEIAEELRHPLWGRGIAYDEKLARQQLPQKGTGPNNEGARARWSQERDSIYDPDREHNFLGWSWYYSSDFARMIYWRWLGWKQTFSVLTMGWKDGYDEAPDIGTPEWEEKHGRLCLPGILLHPVKSVKPPLDEEDEDKKLN